MKQRNKQLIKDIIIITVIAVAAGFGINMVHPRGFVLVSKADFAGKRIVSISSQEAKIKYDSRSALFIDAREKEEYDSSHIPGAVNIPVDSGVFSRHGRELSLSDRPVEIVIYCDGASCGASGVLAKKILDLTTGHIYVLEKGFPDWASRGFPVQKAD